MSGADGFAAAQYDYRNRIASKDSETFIYDSQGWLIARVDVDGKPITSITQAGGKDCISRWLSVLLPTPVGPLRI